MREALADGLAAARIAADRTDLWLPGSLAWLASVGWLPLLLAVTPPPSEGDLAFLGAGLASSSAWPLNAIAVVAALAGLVLVAFALAALGEAALLRQLLGGGSRLGSDTRRLFLARLAAGVPTIMAVIVLGVVVAAIAPREFSAPDIGGELWVRIAVRVAPWVVAVTVVLLLGGALSAAVATRVSRHASEPVPRALVGAAADLGRRPITAAFVAVVTAVTNLAFLVLAAVLLRVLWAPIGGQLGVGAANAASAGVLLVGFVAIWLCLVLGGGALHAWASTWWTLRLAGGRRGDGRIPKAEGIGAT